MYLTANPEKGKTEAEKVEMRERYKPGDKVLMDVKAKPESRADEEERRMVERVQEMSLREAIGGSGEGRGVGGSGGEARREDRRTARRRAYDGIPESSRSGLRTERGEGRRRRRSTSRQQRSDDESDSQSGRRPIEHQSSIRSLISAGGAISTEDINREIEDFARQIQEEGLLDGLDLDNLDLNNDDELSRRITDAYRRRQRQRMGHESRSASGHSHRSDPTTPEHRSYRGSSSRPESRHRHTHSSRSSSRTDQADVDDRSRPPTSSGATHLEVHEPRRRARTTSGGRSATTPVIPAPLVTPAARSQTDLSLRTYEGQRHPNRPAIAGEARSTSSPTVTTSVSESPATQSMPFRARAAAAAAASSSNNSPGTFSSAQRPSINTDRPPRRPSEIRTSPPLFSPTINSPPSPSLVPPPLLSPSARTSHHHQLYPEPSVTCRRCARPHIEYELHYNCSTCHAGSYNICMDCYRRGRGCLHWFGFGYGAWKKWEKLRASNPRMDPPHMLTANRYQRPKTTPGGAEGRITLSAQDPEMRLESGTFCARCEKWTNECYWRCDVCNEGDWGFCNGCVNTGRCCNHALLPLTYEDLEGGGRIGPRAGRRPDNAVVGEQAIGPFRVLVFTARCSVCQEGIKPEEERFQCFACEWVACTECYKGLERDARISAENGEGGWRRCLNGHRMAIVGFVAGKDGALRRRVLVDWVGGRKLGFEKYDVPGLQVCYWFDDGRKMERLVTLDVAATAVDPDADVGVRSRWTTEFPADGGSGIRAVAKWAWYPAAGTEDELLFPKGAEVRELEDVNGEWFHGVYMGAKGLLPAQYVVPLLHVVN